MRLCHCPNCKQEIEPDAPICPHCAANVNQHRARDVARFLLFGMAVVFVFTLIGALNDAAPHRIGHVSVEAERVAAARTPLFTAPAERQAPVKMTPALPARPYAAAVEDDPALREWRPQDVPGGINGAGPRAP
jgi:predicted nucleic acid-binding Zn ribbon protein